ncbi:hypothetical protein RRG08_016164 [Elysia crispata]|uniref:Uncharacterized protein n=1 Tax=Elysia crispata TaxID=231223 RepID=A0AAE1D920_9GAST|nr:hypothetical protein RRG08_016164 [Elysia crispata]
MRYMRSRSPGYWQRSYNAVSERARPQRSYNAVSRRARPGISMLTSARGSHCQLQAWQGFVYGMLHERNLSRPACSPRATVMKNAMTSSPSLPQPDKARRRAEAMIHLQAQSLAGIEDIKQASSGHPAGGKIWDSPHSRTRGRDKKHEMDKSLWLVQN